VAEYFTLPGMNVLFRVRGPGLYDGFDLKTKRFTANAFTFFSGSDSERDRMHPESEENARHLFVALGGDPADFDGVYDT
jgi:hypothetical protein